MAYEPKDNSGALFKNDKQGIENRPDYRGDIVIEGTAYYLSAWLKEGKSGKFMSLSATPKTAQAGKPAPSSKPAPTFDEMDSDLPF